MRGLRAKIAAIIIASVVAVVLVATAITTLLIVGDEDRRFAPPTARQIVLFSDALSGLDRTTATAREGRGWRPGDVLARPPVGQVLKVPTEALRAELKRLGEMRYAMVLATSDGDRIVTLALGDGQWMLFPFPSAPTFSPILVAPLLAWLLLVVLGVGGVALVIAHHVTRPFGVLERAVASVGSDGLLPQTPETGSGEMRRMARTLNGLSDRVKAAMESRMRLVAAAGHDLRTPMTRMRLRAEFLGDEDRAAWLRDIAELEAIADSAIKLVREEGVVADRESVALDELVRETASDLKQSRLPVDVGETAPARVSAGPLALRRALRNLITNAATHGGGAHIRVETGGGEARVVIDDNGPGIPDELIGQSFEPFFQANPGRSQPVRGAGLGLAIAREIVERFGGTITIANRPEGGLRQVVTLALAGVENGPA